MKAAVEIYKGIEFVRISALPEDQKRMIWTSFHTNKIIKILRDKELLNDCVKYDDYSEWYRQNFTNRPNSPAPSTVRAKELKLAYK